MKQVIIAAVIALLILIVGAQAGYIWKLLQDEKRPRDLYQMVGNTPSPPAVARNTTPNFSRIQTTFDDPMAMPDGWDPVQEIENMQRMMNRMFQESYSRGRSGAAAVHSALSYEPDWDVKETSKEYVIKLDLPGIEKDKVAVKVQNHQLVISGERQVEREEENDQNNFYRMERSFGSFSRSLPLPADADAEHLKATSANGVLTIRIPKLSQAEVPQEKKVEIQ